MSEQTNISFEAALMIALRADAQKELDTLPTPEQLEELYPDTSQWDDRMAAALRRKKHRPVLKRVLLAALTLVILTIGALAVNADFRRAVYTMISCTCRCRRCRWDKRTAANPGAWRGYPG